LTDLRGATAELHRSLYGREPQGVNGAAGRVNLIGEHTDYNDGFVLPAPIDRHVWVSAAPGIGDRVRVHAADMGDRAEFSLNSLMKDPEHPWSDYIMGVARVLSDEGHRLIGADMAVHGDVPIGAGLSSSAALLVASLRAFASLNRISIGPEAAAHLARRAENEFVGVQCGIMDQYVASLGEQGKALYIDCRSLEHRQVELPRDHRVVVVNTMKSRDLASSAYNERRLQCMEVVRIIGKREAGVASLRDVSPEMLVKHWAELPPVIQRRARHVITENQRVQESVELLGCGDVDAFGELMYDSHESLRHDYEASCRELDVLVDATLGMRGVAGARMTGAGFGGCTVNLVEGDYVERFTGAIKEKYFRSTAKRAEVYVV